MTDSIPTMIEAFIDRQIEVTDDAAEVAMAAQLAAGPGGYNHNVYNKRVGMAGFPQHQRPPHCIYFYYVRLNTNGKLLVDHYFWPSGDPDSPHNPANPATWPVIQNDRTLPPNQNLELLIERLAKNARPSVPPAQKNPQPLPNINFNNIKWKRRSWIVIYVDEANWSLFKHQVGGKPAIVFTSAANDPSCTSNESFFDADDFVIDMPITRRPGQTDKRTAVAFINHMKKNYAGDDVGATDALPYKFSIFFDVKFEDGTDVMKVIFDPGGVNDGTPLNP